MSEGVEGKRERGRAKGGREEEREMMEGGDAGLEEREGGRRGRMEVMCRLWTR